MLANVRVCYAGKWNSYEINKLLKDDQGVTYVLTFIDKKKFLEVDPNFCKFFRFSSLFSSSGGVRYDKGKLSPTSSPEVPPESTSKVVASSVSLKDLLVLKNENLFDEELEIILTKSSVNMLIQCLKLTSDEVISEHEQHSQKIHVGILSAGTSEMNIVTMGFIYMTLLRYSVTARIDLGIDNLKKTKSIIGELNSFDIIIVTAGMEAVLPSVIANCTYRPVIAVPSNVSYGFGFRVAPIRSIISSDVPGVAVFNIGNIFGACVFAHNIALYLIDRKIKKSKSRSKPKDNHDHDDDDDDDFESLKNGNTTTIQEMMRNADAEIAICGWTLEQKILKTKALKKKLDIFEPTYSRSLKILRHNEKTEHFIRIRPDENLFDRFNGIRIMYPLMNVDDKHESQVDAFKKSHPYYILRGQNTEKYIPPPHPQHSCTENSDISLEQSINNTKSQLVESSDEMLKKFLYSNVDQDMISKRGKFYDQRRPVLALCGGVGDLRYALEFKTYLSYSGIQCDIVESINLNMLLLYEKELHEKVFCRYDLFVVVAGTNATISNMIGRVVGNKPTIVIPTSKNFNDRMEDVTLMSVLNNCVGGIATVNVNNVYSAACLICSILIDLDDNDDY